MHKITASAAMAATATGMLIATAAPASAGGIIVIASPSHDNTCGNYQTDTQPKANTTQGSGSVQGLLAQLPIIGPLNHCGGADLTPGSRRLPLIDHRPVD